MKTIAKVFLVFLLFIWSVCYLAGIGVRSTLLSRAYYDGLLNEKNIVQALYRDIVAQLPESMCDAIEDDAVNAYAPDDANPAALAQSVQNAFDDAFGIEWMEQQIFMVIDDMLAFVEGRQPTLNVVIDLRARKERFEQNLVQQLQSLSPQQLEQMGLSPQHVERAVSAFMDDMDIPDAIDLHQALEQHTARAIWTRSAMGIRTFYGAFHIVAFIGFGVILALLVLLGRLSGGLIWFGSGVLASGLLFTGTLMVIKGALSAAAMRGFWFPGGAEIPYTSIVAFFDYTAGKMVVAPIVFVVVGAAALAGGLILGNGRVRADTGGTAVPAD